MLILLICIAVTNLKVMSNTTNTGIINSWSLVAFAQSHGRMKIAPCVKRDDQGNVIDSWKSCAFQAPDGGITFVSFSPKLGELTPQEISNRRDELQVVECTTKAGNQMFSLCKKGENTWEDVNLGF